MRSINLCLLLLLISACGTLKNGGGKQVRVNGTIYIEKPVCQPGQPPAKGDAVPVANTTYYIKDGSINDPAVIADKQLQTDSTGAFTVRLKPGTYAVVHPDKLMTFGEFRLKHGATSTYYKDRDDDCFQRWYNSADFLLKVENDTTVAFTVKSRCYTYTNPCQEYTGPK